MTDERHIAKIRPFSYEDLVTGQRLEVKVSPYFTTLHIGERVYYFVKDSGEFDGTSMPMSDPKDDG